jgi:hypothetical protein
VANEVDDWRPMSLAEFPPEGMKCSPIRDFGWCNWEVPVQYEVVALNEPADCGCSLGMPVSIVWWLADSFEIEFL